jgi:hypothetical protein
VLNNEPITIEKLKELAESLERRVVFLNQKTHDLVLQQLDFKPTNLVVNNFIPDYQAIIMNGKQLKEMEKGLISKHLFDS